MNIVIPYRLPKLIEIVIAYLFECLLCVNQYKWLIHLTMVPNRKKSMSRLYIVTLLI